MATKNPYSRYGLANFRLFQCDVIVLQKRKIRVKDYHFQIMNIFAEGVGELKYKNSTSKSAVRR